MMHRKYIPNNSLKIHVVKLFIWTRYCASYAKPIMVINANMLFIVVPQCMFKPEISNHILERSTVFFKLWIILNLHSHLDSETVLSLALKYQIYSLNTCKLKLYFYKYSTETTSHCSSYKNNSIYSHTQRGKTIVNCCQGKNAVPSWSYRERRFQHFPRTGFQIVISHHSPVMVRQGKKLLLRIKSGFLLKKGWIT